MTKLTGILHENQYTLLIITRLFLLRMRNVLDRNCRDNQNTFYVQNFFPKNRTFYEIMWKNTVEPQRPKVYGEVNSVKNKTISFIYLAGCSTFPHLPAPI